MHWLISQKHVSIIITWAWLEVEFELEDTGKDRMLLESQELSSLLPRDKSVGLEFSKAGAAC